jgi:hypothetical protein
MNPAMQRAWLMWSAMDDMGELATGYAKNAFEAGFDAAIAQSEVERSTPAGSTTTAEDIYAAYPRKVAKKDALKAIFNAMKTAGREKLLVATKQYAAAMAKCPLEERKYIPHPATWFNRGSYEDDPAEWGNPEVSQFSVSN